MKIIAKKLWQSSGKTGIRKTANEVHKYIIFLSA